MKPAEVTSEVVETITSTRKISASGASRKVYDLGTFVLKVDRPGVTCYGQCADEIRRWESAPPELRTFLCPILAHDETGTWVIMPKCKPLGTVTDRDARRLEKLRRKLDACGILDQHKGNLMRYRGHAVSVDYAYS